MRRFSLFREQADGKMKEVLEGVIMTSGVVFIQWLTEWNSFGHYLNLEQFKSVHIKGHSKPSSLAFYDVDTMWHCYGCGASGHDGNFCSMCGTPSTAYLPATEGFQITERWLIEKELAILQMRIHTAIYKALTPLQWTNHKELTRRLKEIERDGYEFKPQDPIDKQILDEELERIENQRSLEPGEFNIEAIRKNVVEKLERSAELAMKALREGILDPVTATAITHKSLGIVDKDKG